MTSASAVVAQVGQVASTLAATVAITTLAVTGKLPVSDAVAIILGLAGIGQPVGVALHNLANRATAPQVATAPPETPHGP